MTAVKLIHATPKGDELVAYMARVSNPEGQDNPDSARLISYLIRHKHWSPFEMVSACVEINTTRDIARQILRHRSFHFQEFCVAGNTNITLELPNGEKRGKRVAYTRTIEHLYKLQEEGKKMPSGVRVYDEVSKTFKRVAIKEVFKTGVKPIYRVKLDNGRFVDSTKEHKFFTDSGWDTLEDAVGLVTKAGRAAITKDVAFACNGVPAYQSLDWMQSAKEHAINNGTGLHGIAELAGCTTHTVRKWLKKLGLQFTKKEVASYTEIWNKGLKGYSWGKHSLETIEKMRASAKKGADSNLWRGGVDRGDRLKIADWCNAHRAEFLKNANYQCGKCGSSKNLELHHVEPVYSHPERAYDKENIEVLCESCHDNVHGIAGHHKTWRERGKGNTLTIHWSKVVSIEYLGEQMTYDMEVDHESHNYVANGIVTHNSQRYADASLLGDMVERECRLQDTKNRQNSLDCDKQGLSKGWQIIQEKVWDEAIRAYKNSLDAGIAKEQARALLPEGLTPSRMYMHGTLRDWIHYIEVRTDPSTQKEHRLIAQAISDVLRAEFPAVFSAVNV